MPTTRATVTLRPELSRGDVVLDKARWRLVAAIGGGITVATLGEALELGELPVSRAVKDLIELGVVDLDATSVEEPVAEPVAEPVDEPARGRRGLRRAGDRAGSDRRAVRGHAPGVHRDASPCSGCPSRTPNSARAQLDEFAAGFGLSDPSPFSAEIVDAPSQDGPTVGHENGFAGFDAEVRGATFDQPFDEAHHRASTP